jgi:hypothetical protein
MQQYVALRCRQILLSLFVMHNHFRGFKLGPPASPPLVRAHSSQERLRSLLEEVSSAFSNFGPTTRPGSGYGFFRRQLPLATNTLVFPSFHPQRKGRNWIQSWPKSSRCLSC